MITSAQVFAQMEKHLQAAKMKGSNDVRDELIAIKTLCEIMLTNEQLKQPSATHPQPILQSSPNIHQNKIEEDDANGTSIFDF